MPQHVRVRATDAHAGAACEVSEKASGGVAVHPRSAGVEQDRSRGAAAYGAVEGTANGRRQRDQNELCSFAAHS